GLRLGVRLGAGLAHRGERVLEHRAEARPRVAAGAADGLVDAGDRIGDLRHARIGACCDAGCGHGASQPFRMSRVRWIVARVAPMRWRFAWWERWASGRWVISISGLSLGYLTWPGASAAGLPGSCLILKSEVSGRTGPSATTRASSERSSCDVKLGMRGR